MKSTIFRIISAMLALVMMVCCFTACGGNGDPEITKPSNVEGPNPNDIPANNDITIPDDSTTTTTTTTTTRPSTNNSTGGSTGGSNSGGTVGTTAGGSTGGSNGGGQVSQEDLIAVLNAAGYAYDAEQQIFYSTINPWQRHFGFGDIYDEAASYVNMRYTTFKADFKYDGLLWRLQWWKGQYGVLEGAELGVYTKDPNSTSDYYDCAADDQLLEMSMEYYRTIKDYNNGNRLFYREEQEHWWLTGFKVGYTVGSNKSVVKATLKAYDKEMADGIESGLRAVTTDQGVWKGFEKYGPNMKGKNFYVRNGNTFTVVWVDAGFENYQTGDISPKE